MKDSQKAQLVWHEYQFIPSLLLLLGLNWPGSSGQSASCKLRESWRISVAYISFQTVHSPLWWCSASMAAEARTLSTPMILQNRSPLTISSIITKHRLLLVAIGSHWHWYSSLQMSCSSLQVSRTEVTIYPSRQLQLEQSARPVSHWEKCHVVTRRVV